MKTLQEYLDQKYPTKEDKEKVKKIDTCLIEPKVKDKLKTGNLDLSDYPNLEELVLIRLFRENKWVDKINLEQNVNLKKLSLTGNQLNSLNISKNEKLIDLSLSENQLTGISLEKNLNLSTLYIGENCLTSIEFLDQLINPEKLEKLIILVII